MTPLVPTRRTIRRAIHIEHIRYRGVRLRQYSAKRRAQLTCGRGGTIDPVGWDASTRSICTCVFPLARMSQRGLKCVVEVVEL